MVSGVWSNLGITATPPPQPVVPAVFGGVLKGRIRMYAWRAPFDSTPVQRWLSVADAGVGTESTPTPALLVADTGVGTEGLVGLSSTFSTADSGAGAEAVVVFSASIVLPDFGVGTENVLLDIGQPTGFQLPWFFVSSRPLLYSWFNTSPTFITLTDLGTAADQVLGVAPQAMAIADAGAGTDAVVVVQQNLITIQDVMASLDVLFPISVDEAVTDAGSVNEVLAIASEFSLSDFGVGTDAAVVVGSQLVNVADAMLGTDSITVVAPVNLLLDDFGSGADSISIDPKDVGVQDFGSGFDTAGVLGPISEGFGTQRWWIIQAQRRTWTLH
jgi:hypothetical protein